MGKGGRDLPCYGACGGVPAWRSPDGYPCSLCGGSGVVKAPLTREEEGEQAWSVWQRRQAKYERKRKMWSKHGRSNLQTKPARRRIKRAAAVERRGIQDERERKEWLRTRGPTPEEMHDLAKQLERAKEELCRRTQLKNRHA